MIWVGGYFAVGKFFSSASSVFFVGLVSRRLLLVCLRRCCIGGRWYVGWCVVCDLGWWLFCCWEVLHGL